MLAKFAFSRKGAKFAKNKNLKPLRDIFRNSRGVTRVFLRSRGFPDNRPTQHSEAHYVLGGDRTFSILARRLFWPLFPKRPRNVCTFRWQEECALVRTVLSS